MAAATLYDRIAEWSFENVGEGVPSPETLEEVEQLLHAIDEFLLEPIANGLKKMIAAADEAIEHVPVPEPDRAVSFADVGRLIAFTDAGRISCGYALDTLSEITLRAHEELVMLAEGYRGRESVVDEEFNARLRRFHGLSAEVGVAR